MSRAILFVVVCSLIILVLFGVSCFLISTVNPPPLNIEKTTEEAYIIGKDGEKNLVNYFLRKMEPSDVLKYGLEKVHETSDFSPPPSLRQNIDFDNFIPTTKFKNPHLVNVYPPIWPPGNVSKTTSTVTEKSLRTTKLTNTTKTDQDNTTVTEAITKEFPIDKYRRSINAIEKNIDKNTGSVILKILDDDGQSRIEIKLNPNEIFKKRKPRMNRSSLKRDPKPEMFEEPVNSDLPKYTEIKIHPNDTVVIDNDVIDLGGEFDSNIVNENRYNTDPNDIIRLGDIHSNVNENKTDTINNDYQFATFNESVDFTLDITSTSSETQNRTEDVRNTTQILEMKESTGIVNTPLSTAEVFGLKVMFDNVTKSFNGATSLF